MIVPALYDAPPDLLRGRSLLVTGAGDGIGRAASLSFATHGATVILLGRTQSKLETVYDEIIAAGGPEPAIHCLDLRGAREGDYVTLAETLERELGSLHGLLHNAALLGPRTPIESYSAERWQDVLQVNLTANFLLTKAVLPLMREAQDASILFTSSGVGRRGRAYWGAYAVSKFGVEGLAQILADELANTSNVRVNCVNPGATRTAMRREAYPAEAPRTNPLPEQIMAAYLYLMGPDSIGITGQSFDAQT
jgi:NAD(P)-dependent dehydrogenase (short-subunit alcohol dehydrogenase family)